MKTIGFVGTAKNTGKTTTALHMLELAGEAGLRTALTSIGYDGENTDHVTGLPKPRYFAGRGVTVATARGCLTLGSAKTSDVRPTGLKTILGEIVIAAVSEPGTVVLAGPNRRTDLQSLLDQLKSLEIDLTLVDGALNRLAAMSAADGMVLSTGAAFDERIDMLASHAAAIESLFHYQRFNGIDEFDPAHVTFSTECEHRWLDSGSVLDEPMLRQVTEWLLADQANTLWIPGVFSPQLFQNLVQACAERLRGVDFVFASPVNLLAAGSPYLWRGCFEQLNQFGATVYYRTPLPLHFMTVNPFYPKYRQKTGSYIAAYVDKKLLLETVRSAIQSTPVVDIYQPPHPDLLAQCGIDSNARRRNP